jgi:FdhD protein
VEPEPDVRGRAPGTGDGVVTEGGDPERVREVRRTRFARGAAAKDEPDLVAREEPLEIQVNGAPVAVVMRTPGDDLDLVAGFLVSERIVAGWREVASLHHASSGDAERADNVVRAALAHGAPFDPDALRRNLFASSSCGVCGKASLEQALASAPPLEAAAQFSTAFFAALPDRLRAAQPVFAATGGLHGAALFDAGGAMLCAREDVGRHNAVDKVIGWAARSGRLPLADCALLVSGRVSFEIVQKALAARVPAIAAVSAPTSLAVELAERAGIALVAFLRGEAMSVFGARERVAPR